LLHTCGTATSGHETLTAHRTNRSKVLSNRLYWLASVTCLDSAFSSVRRSTIAIYSLRALQNENLRFPDWKSGWFAISIVHLIPDRRQHEGTSQEGKQPASVAIGED